MLDGFFVTRLPACISTSTAGRESSCSSSRGGARRYGCEDLTLAIGACGALLEYAGKTQGRRSRTSRGEAERAGEYVRLDAATRRNLELTETLRGEPTPTLFSLLDECATAWAAVSFVSGCITR